MPSTRPRLTFSSTGTAPNNIAPGMTVRVREQSGQSVFPNSQVRQRYGDDELRSTIILVGAVNAGDTFQFDNANPNSSTSTTVTAVN